LLVAPLPALLGGALNDRLRLTGSEVGNRDELLRRLDAAATTLEKANATELEKSRARVELQVVRTTINVYRGEQWEAMLRARKQLLTTMVLTGIMADVALVLALLAGADRVALIAAASFYLVGAI